MTHPDTPGHAPVTRDPVEVFVVLSKYGEPLEACDNADHASHAKHDFERMGHEAHVSSYISEEVVATLRGALECASEEAAAHEIAIADAEQRGARAERERLKTEVAIEALAQVLYHHDGGMTDEDFFAAGDGTPRREWFGDERDSGVVPEWERDDYRHMARAVVEAIERGDHLRSET